jgi:XTP/dITP diphosphohydrolase
VVLATTNPAKLDRLRGVLEETPLDPLPLPADAGPGPEESGASFAANARLKAAYWSKRLGRPALASEGGLALPGLGQRWNAHHTARGAGPGANDEERARHLLRLAGDLRGLARTGRWTEALALVDEGQLIAAWEASGEDVRLVERFEPNELRPGFWAASLCFVPRFGKSLARLTDAELAQTEDTWTVLRRQVRTWIESGQADQWLRASS